MATFDQLRRGVTRALDTVAEGWQHLVERAGHALTWFRPTGRGELDTVEDQIVRRASRWGLLAAEVEEQADEVVVRLEAPGMEADDFDLAVIDDYLVVRGEKRAAREERRGEFHVMECAYGEFERAVPLPVPVEEGKAKARYRKGVLTVRLPKSAAGRRRRIDVEAG